MQSVSRPFLHPFRRRKSPRFVTCDFEKNSGSHCITARWSFKRKSEETAFDQHMIKLVDPQTLMTLPPELSDAENTDTAAKPHDGKR